MLSTTSLRLPYSTQKVPQPVLSVHLLHSIPPATTQSFQLQRVWFYGGLQVAINIFIWPRNQARIRAWYLLLAHASKFLGIPRSSILFAYYRVILILMSYHRDGAVLTRAEWILEWRPSQNSLCAALYELFTRRASRSVLIGVAQESRHFHS